MRAPSGPSRVTPSPGRGAPGPGREPRAPRFSTCKTGLRRVLKASTCCNAEKSGHAKCSGHPAKRPSAHGHGPRARGGTGGRGAASFPPRSTPRSTPRGALLLSGRRYCRAGHSMLPAGDARLGPRTGEEPHAASEESHSELLCSDRPVSALGAPRKPLRDGRGRPGVHTRTRTVPYPRGSGLGNSLPKPWIVTSCNSRNPGDDIF